MAGRKQAKRAPRGPRRSSAAATAERAAKALAKARAPKRRKVRPAPKLPDGSPACDRCHKEKPRRKVWVEAYGRDRRICDGCYETEERERALRHIEATGREKMVMDEVRSPDSRLVELFVLDRLGQYDLSGATIYLTLRTDTALRKNATCVRHNLPSPPRGRGSTKWRPWMEAKVGLIDARKVEWPVHEEVNVGTKKIQDEVAVVLMRKDWYFETEDVALADAAEALAFAAGEGLHKILVRLKQVPGRAVGTEARRFAIAWLGEFREWRRGRGGPARQETLGFAAVPAAG